MSVPSIFPCPYQLPAGMSHPQSPFMCITQVEEESQPFSQSHSKSEVGRKLDPDILGSLNLRYRALSDTPSP